MCKNEPKIRIISSIFPVILHSDHPNRQSRPSTCSNEVYTAFNFNNNLMWSLSPEINGMHYFLTIKEPILSQSFGRQFSMGEWKKLKKGEKEKIGIILI